jgi:tetratricopeptide (TPR) repeat protein
MVEKLARCFETQAIHDFFLNDPYESVTAITDVFYALVRPLRSEYKENTSTASARDKLALKIHDICCRASTCYSQLLPTFYYDSFKGQICHIIGDANRYIAELDNFDKEKAITRAKTAYEKGWSYIRENNIDSIPGLSFALNYSVFLYEIMNQHEQAIQIAKEAFDEGVNRYCWDEHENPNYYLQILKDNLMLWISMPVDEDS